MFYSCARRFVSVTLMTSLLSSSVIPAFAGIDDDNDAVANKAVVSTKASVPGVPDERTDFSTGMNILLDVVGSQNPVLVGEILKYLPLQDRLNLMRSGPSVTEKDTDAVKTLREKFMKLQGAVSLFNKTDGEYRITEDLIAKNPHLFAKGARNLVIDRVKEGRSGVNSFGPQCPSLQKVKFLDFSTATDYGLADFLNYAISGALAEIHLNILHSLDFQIDSEDAVTGDMANELFSPITRWKEVGLSEEIIPSAIERLNSLSASAKYPKTVLTVLQKFKATFFNEWNQDLRMPPQVALFLNADAEPTSEDYVALRKFLRKYVHVFTRNDVIAGSVVPNGGVGLDPVWFLSVNAYTLCFAKDLFLQGEAPSLRIALLSVLSKYQPTTLRETIEHAKVMFTPDMTSQDKGKIIDALAQVRPSWREEIAKEALSMTGGMNGDGKASMVEQRHVDKYSKTLSRVSFDDLRTTFYPAGAPGGAAWIPSEMLALMEVLRFSPPQNHTSALKHIKSLSLDSLSFERKRDVFRDLLSYPAAKHEDLVRYVRELNADATASFPDIFKNLVAIDPVRLDSAMTHGRKLWKNGEAGTFKAEIIKILASFPITHHEGVSRHVAS